MRNLLIILFSFLVLSPLVAQTIPTNRVVDWSMAGLAQSIPSYQTIVNITSFGAVGDGTTINDDAFSSALNSLNGKSGVIYFPAGTYLFHSGFSLPDSTILRGESSQSTFLKFDLSHSVSDLISITGSVASQSSAINADANKGAVTITVNNTSGFSQGDYIKIYETDTDLVTSTWAYNSVAQVALIQSVSGNTITISNPLRTTYPLTLAPQIVKLTPITGVGIECLNIQRLDSTAGQTSNISFTVAAKCWVTSVESYMTNYAHVEISTSTNIYVSGSYFHHAFAYGGDGQGYGAVAQYSSGECLIENSIFNNLRHSMMVQAGANGNVFSYNYSVNPYWVQSGFPTNSAGDIVLHGNYPFANLFEDNSCQNIVIDNSHGINGPYNTIFRNRAALYGIVMNSGAGDSTNFVGNDIPNKGFLMGNYILTGNGNFTAFNTVQGTVTPSTSGTLADNSYYLTSAPSYFTASYHWPPIGNPYSSSNYLIPAQDAYNSGNYTTCTQNATTGILPASKAEFLVYPNPVSDELYIVYSHTQPLQAELYNIQGALLSSYTLKSSASIDMQSFTSGVYILKIANEYFRIVKVE